MSEVREGPRDGGDVECLEPGESIDGDADAKRAERAGGGVPARRQCPRQICDTASAMSSVTCAAARSDNTSISAELARSPAITATAHATAGGAAGGEGVGPRRAAARARSQEVGNARVAAHPREFLSVDARGLGLVRDDAEHLGCDVWGDAAEAGVLERAEGGDGIARVRLDVALHGGEFLSRHRPLRRPILLGETSHVDAPQSIAGGGGHLHLVGIDAAAGTGDIVVAPGGAGVLVKVAVLLRLSPATPPAGATGCAPRSWRKRAARLLASLRALSIHSDSALGSRRRRGDARRGCCRA